MRTLTYILAFVVIFLSAKPAIDSTQLLSDTSKSCVSSSKCNPISNSQKSENRNNQTENDICNPFQSCVSCELHVVTTPFSPVSKAHFTIEKFKEYQSFIASQFISDFWQPPKFV